MNELQVFKNEQFGEIRTVEEEGKVLFCGSDVAKALGYINSRDALSRHCKGVVKRDTLTNGGEQNLSFIPEGDLYRLITHSKLPAAEQFESWVFDEVLPTIRKTGSYAVAPMSPLDLLETQVQVMKELQSQQERQSKAIEETNSRIDEIRDVVALNPQSWREECRHMIVKIAHSLGGNEYISLIQTEIYSLVDLRGGVSLSTRLTNKRRRMADEGVCKSKRDKLNKIDVIAEDKKLIEIYIAIVKEMSVKYGISAA